MFIQEICCFKQLPQFHFIAHNCFLGSVESKCLRGFVPTIGATKKFYAILVEIFQEQKLRLGFEIHSCTVFGEMNYFFIHSDCDLSKSSENSKNQSFEKSSMVKTFEFHFYFFKKVRKQLITYKFNLNHTRFCYKVPVTRVKKVDIEKKTRATQILNAKNK